MQMTAATQAGALSRVELNWHAIDWHAARRVVRRLQARIVKATQEKRWGKVKKPYNISLPIRLAAKLSPSSK